MKQIVFRTVVLVAALVMILALISGCARSAATPTLAAQPEALPAQTSPLPQTSPLFSPLTPGDERFPAQVAIPAAAEAAVNWAVADLAERLGIDPAQVQVLAVESVQWGDTSLGCPEPGMMYAQVITPGYLIVLGAGEAQYEYHTAEGSNSAVFCQEKAMIDSSIVTSSGPTPIVLADAQSPVETAINDLARQLRVSSDIVTVIGAERAKMSLQNLGCYAQGEMPGADTDAFVMGDEITLQVNDSVYIYHAHARQVVFCGSQ